MEDILSSSSTSSPNLEDKFGTEEYAVFASILVASAAIGVYFGFFAKKNDSNEDFLMAGRDMNIIPVALSLICSFVSAITLLGNPVEVYYYGTQYLLIATGFIPITLALAYIFVPVFFKLQLTSAYEYFELRFNRTVRLVMSVISLIYLILLMSVWVYGPALALDQVAGINVYLSIGLTFIVCIFYSAIGGLKAVLWTDALQATLMLVSLAAVVGKGISDIGGIDIVWERALESDRVQFLNFDTDLRTRHTFWTSTIGGYLMWVPLYAATQSQIQRYLSVSSLAKSRMAMFLNMIGLMVVIFLCFLAGLVAYARYYQCDPIGNEQVEAADQLVPLFVMQTLGDYPGLPGLFVAGITGASLSSVSSALNALSAIVTEDYVKAWKPNLTDSQMSRISKLTSVVGGLLSFAFVFIAQSMGDIFPIALTMVGVFVGPTMGLFTLGMIFPWANAWGSFSGMIAGLALTLSISAGSIIASDELPNQKLKLSLEGCDNSTHSMHFSDMYRTNDDWKNGDDSTLIKILSLAPTWYPGLGNLSTVIFGLIFSLILTKWQPPAPVKRDYFSEPVLNLYEKFLPESFLKPWVEPKEEVKKSNHLWLQDYKAEDEEKGDTKVDDVEKS